MIWVLPGVVFALLALPVVLALRRCIVEASALRRSLGALAELAPAVREVQLEASSLAAAVPVALRRRSVVAPADPDELAVSGVPGRPGLPAGS